ncbi:unnamed protein product, partial [Symbiodinium necroappetens]
MPAQLKYSCILRFGSFQATCRGSFRKSQLQFNWQAAVDEDGDTVQVSQGSCPEGTELWCQRHPETLVERTTPFASLRGISKWSKLPFAKVGRSAARYGHDLSTLFEMRAETSLPMVQSQREAPALAQSSGRAFRCELRLLRPGDLALLEDVRHSFRKCDGYRIFSDRRPIGSEDDVDIVVVSVTQQPTSRGDDHWLYHRNMVGLMPAWKHMLESDVHSQYDWFLNVEFDHLLVPSLLRKTIAEYLSILRTGKKEQQRSAHGPLLLMFGNAFAFNRELVTDMGGQWTVLGQTAPAGQAAAGCPTFMEGRFEWPDSCSQDIVYPNMVSVLAPPVPAYGAPGCGQKPNDFPLACFEYSRQPVLDTGLDQIGLVQEVIAVRNLASEALSN